MSLYIKTEDYQNLGITKYSSLETIREVVQRELHMERVFVSFVNNHEFIRVDFLKPRPTRRYRRRSQKRKNLEKTQLA